MGMYALTRFISNPVQVADGCANRFKSSAKQIKCKQKLCIRLTRYIDISKYRA